MTWLRKILRVTRTDRIKNIDIRETLQQKETMVDKIRRRRLTRFGHVSQIDERRLPSSAMYCYITDSAVALHCCKAHAKINRKIENS